MVLDLTRILAGPTCTQMLGDLGAQVIKIEHPEKGDDTRGWGPPFLQDSDGNDTNESAYYLCANRNKRSVTINIADAEGVELVKQLASRADILVENFKLGDLERRGLGYEALSSLNPRLIYCSITGFGQTGPYAKRAGYDFLAQGMGGIMSLTGFPDNEGGHPTKIGVGITDVMCGMYAVTAILAALNARNSGGKGQYIDIALLDSQVAWLINQGTAYLTSGEVPQRIGNGHPNIVPYQTFPAKDGEFILAVGNNEQFQRFCDVAGNPALATDKRFKTNADRVRNREALIPLINDLTRARSINDWIKALEKVGVPCGPVNDLAGVFANPQVKAREMKITMPHPTSASGHVDLLGNPIRFSETPVQYRRPPPLLGEDTFEVLQDQLGLGTERLQELAEKGIIKLGDDDQ
ncbi:CoA transferase [Rhodobacteraceae bacterium RKSG542]|nr:CoA transferase [Pseudovibrio flavus]